MLPTGLPPAGSPLPEGAAAGSPQSEIRNGDREKSTAFLEEGSTEDITDDTEGDEGVNNSDLSTVRTFTSVLKPKDVFTTVKVSTKTTEKPLSGADNVNVNNIDNSDNDNSGAISSDKPDVYIDNEKNDDPDEKSKSDVAFTPKVVIESDTTLKPSPSPKPSPKTQTPSSQPNQNQEVTNPSDKVNTYNIDSSDDRDTGPDDYDSDDDFDVEVGKVIEKGSEVDTETHKSDGSKDDKTEFLDPRIENAERAREGNAQGAVYEVNCFLD